MSDYCYVCDRSTNEECAGCGQPVCKKHGRRVDDEYFCLECIEAFEAEEDYDDDSDEYESDEYESDYAMEDDSY